MYLFFRLIDDRGVKQKRVAALMNVSEASYSMVKAGRRPVTDDFRRKGAAAFALLGLRRAGDGALFSEEELFAPSSVLEGTETVTEVA